MPTGPDTIMEKGLDNEGLIDIAETSKPIEKVLRRLAQNLRLLVKPFAEERPMFSVENNEIEADSVGTRTRTGQKTGGGLDASQLCYSGTASSGTATFDTEYGRWVEEQNKQTNAKECSASFSNW
ncbi:Transcription factor [Datura stramonium]|uniref:Transcription factor n=1 Tax=Datura stramonium TaxID=4076 RepID=A0ABS8RH11_DATST|nr:Transcription factor [Datura stramonium]